MNIRLQVFAVLCSVGILAYLARLIVTEKLHIRYALIWVLVFLGTIASVLFPGAISLVIYFFGVTTPSNFITWIMLLLLLVYLLGLTVHVSELDHHLERLTQEIGLLRLQAEDRPEVVKKNG